jgi:signal peptidase II
VYVVDRVTKRWAELSLADRPPLQVIPHVLQLDYTTNSGGAFGIGRSAPLLFAGATIVVSAIVVWYSFRVSRLTIALALGLILGGALGNLTDRAAGGWGLSGHVVDFIDFHVWPLFNLADSAVVVGAVLLALATAREGDRGRGGG